MTIETSDRLTELVYLTAAELLQGHDETGISLDEWGAVPGSGRAAARARDPAERCVMAGAVWTLRDWRGVKHQVSACTKDELINLLVTASVTHDQLTAFIEEVQAELITRGEVGPDPYDVA